MKNRLLCPAFFQSNRNGTVHIGAFDPAEDTVLSKLEWAKKGSSERQMRDVVGVLSLKGEDLDHGYLDKWASVLGVADLLADARGRAARPME